MRLDDYLSQTGNTNYLSKAQMTLSERFNKLSTPDGQKFAAFLGAAQGEAKASPNIGEAKAGFLMSSADKFKFFV